MVQLTAKAYGRALLIVGDSRPVKDLLKSLGGRFNPSQSGWMFPGSKHKEVVDGLRQALHNVCDSFAAGAEAADAGSSSAKTTGAVAAVAEPPAKKAKKVVAAGADAGLEGVSWNLPLSEGNDKRRMSVLKFNGEPAVDLREWFGDAGDLKPGKKGILLKKQEWEALKKAMPAIDAELEKLGA
mmetsp:Transcript_52679/g.133743  ORF Transcript_52679/g.133743 Transcript_52679/m.133743 type:complete len:183 (-) Transcript_52679:101-649(-)|eukprot:CAMPEP_0183439794 /NCGR_PEP_ID=MMETSP0370-20130417/79241_1 /TAXON_ID=268820 /ORGANISM="Peridinium aciculiferum, Strain PAER-2" /LENGTH=182 /DNA_ID=CAMNT_0025628389 /DNA_START=73 /DNA_END=621 /DNA_ORIENTATION=-